MHNDTTTKTELSILDRAIKARARRDRDGKKRRPVVDGLIEYAQEQTAIAEREMARANAETQKCEVYRDVIAKQSAAMEAMDEELSKLRAELEQVKDPAIVLETIANEQAEA